MGKNQIITLGKVWQDIFLLKSNELAKHSEPEYGLMTILIKHRMRKLSFVMILMLSLGKYQ
jgi:hypothetical protein